MDTERQLIQLITDVEPALNHHPIINNKTIINNKILNPRVLINRVIINRAVLLYSNKVCHNGKSIHNQVIICYLMELFKFRIFLHKAANHSMFS